MNHKLFLKTSESTWVNQFLVRWLQFSLQALLLLRMVQRVTSNSELDYDKLRFHLSRFLNRLHQPFRNLKVKCNGYVPKCQNFFSNSSVILFGEYKNVRKMIQYRNVRKRLRKCLKIPVMSAYRKRLENVRIFTIWNIHRNQLVHVIARSHLTQKII